MYDVSILNLFALFYKKYFKKYIRNIFLIVYNGFSYIYEKPVNEQNYNIKTICFISWDYEFCIGFLVDSNFSIKVILDLKK